MLLLASSVCGLFKWRQFEPEVILLAVGWYLRFSLSYRDVEELLAERGLHADHVTVWRWVQRYAPEMERRSRARCSTRPTTVGGWTRPTSGSKARGATCIGRWIPPARPSTFSSRPSRTRPQQSASWPKAFEHAEALLNVYDILQELQERGVLDLAKGALASGEEVLQILVNV